MGLRVTIDKRALEELQERLEADPKPVLQRLADRFADTVRRRLEEVALAPSPATLKIRKQRGRTGERPLVDTGDMADSVRPRTTKDSAGASVRWPALPHQIGVTTSADSAIPGKAIPPRPFVVLDDADITFAVEEMGDFYSLD